jgi:outer membrane protein assembly factor BamB
LLRTFETTNPGFELPAGAPTTGDIQSSAVVGADGTIYVSTFAGILFALQDPGRGNALQLRWVFRPDGMSAFHATPAVAGDGTVYLGFSPRQGTAVATLYAVRAPARGLDAEVAWATELGPGRIQTSPTLAADGSIYAVTAEGRLVVLNSDGSVRWTAQTGPTIRIAPTVGPDGSVYVPSTDGRLYAVAPPTGGSGEGQIGWAFDFGAHLGDAPVVSGPGLSGSNGIGSGCTAAVGNDWTIYVGANNSNFYAIAPDGQMKWLYEAEREIAGIWADPVLTADGATVCFGANRGGVYALNTGNGTLRWQYAIEGSVYSGLTLDRAGRIYTGSTIGHLYALSAATGQPVFDYDAQVFPGIWTAPAIRPDGSLAVADRRGRVMLFAP